VVRWIKGGRVTIVYKNTKNGQARSETAGLSREAEGGGWNGKRQLLWKGGRSTGHSGWVPKQTFDRHSRKGMVEMAGESKQLFFMGMRVRDLDKDLRKSGVWVLE